MKQYEKEGESSHQLLKFMEDKNGILILCFLSKKMKGIKKGFFFQAKHDLEF
jgi:hypothetical protein